MSFNWEKYKAENAESDIVEDGIHKGTHCYLCRDYIGPVRTDLNICPTCGSDLKQTATAEVRRYAACQ